MTIVEPRQLLDKDITIPGRPALPMHARQAPKAPRRRHRPGRPPRPWAADVFLALSGIGFGAVVGEVITGETRGSLTAPGGLLIAGGRFAGFTGAYLMLIMVLLIARMGWLERAVGQDRLVRWHRHIAPWALALITAHVVLITLGYAQSSRTGALRQLWVFLSSYPDVLAATVGFGLLVMVAVTSVRTARRRLKYETWWVVHLYTYIALALAFAHQIVTGVSFVGHPLARAIWATAWASTAGLVIVYRFALPVARNLRHQLRIERVAEEAPGVYSVICRGRRLDRLAVSGGQFFQWRFLTRDLWWQAHPYSLSALPRPPLMRVTIKALGDHSRTIAQLKPGTRVLIEGPYGAFTHHAQSTGRVALIAAGVGITPLRAMLEDLPAYVDVAVIVRASAPEDLVHRDEVATLVERRGGQAYAVVGPRRTARLDARSLGRLVPDLAQRDVYVCGPTGFSESILSAALALGVPRDRIHHEAFAF
ncbi:MAG: ferredoxin reductase family protein [Acidimicrobiales bacterium]